jgi:hypothetical protein
MSTALAETRVLLKKRYRRITNIFANYGIDNTRRIDVSDFVYVTVTF